jgi:aspartate ammonia-lyase
MAAARANRDLGLLDKPLAAAVETACGEILDGRFHTHFVVDMIQGGAGTSTNMNANEVIANRALELLGRARGEYRHCHPNSHVNLSQSTNDVYPTALKIALMLANGTLLEVLRRLVAAFRARARAFEKIVKMGRTQLQDAVPMTLGQEFESFAATLEEEIDRLGENAALFLEVLRGESSAARTNTVLANSAVALQCYFPELPLEEALGKARDALLGGKAYEAFVTLMNLQS